MTPDSENVKARFLFAILKQLNLRDVDWEAVANDPCLLKDIPNGHAARMQFSRFRDTICKAESQKSDSHKKSNSRGTDKGRVAKSKKTPQAKEETCIKCESSPSPISYIKAHCNLSDYIKQEPGQSVDLSKLTPAYFPSLAMGDYKDDFFARFFAPISEGTTSSIHPTSTENSGCDDGAGLSATFMDGPADYMAAFYPGSGSMPQSPTYPQFDPSSLATFDIDWENFEQQHHS